jgi:hypothetical protein
LGVIALSFSGVGFLPFGSVALYVRVRGDFVEAPLSKVALRSNSLWVLPGC